MSRLRFLGMWTLGVGILISSLGCPAAKQGKLAGWVTDADGTPLPFVSVVAAGKTAHTDGSGLFSIEDVRAGNKVRADFTLTGYADASRFVSLEANATQTLNVTMKKLNAGSALSDAAAGGTASSGGNSITFPANAIDAGDEKAAAVTVRVTPVDLTDDFKSGFAPGDLRASLPGGKTGVLNVYAMVNFQLTASGSPVSLQPNAIATVRFKLEAGSGLAEGAIVPLWYFDFTAGAWIQQGNGIVVTGSGGTLYIEGTINRMGWWCCATVNVQPFTISGHVFDTESQPAAGAMIIARGLNYHGIARAISDENGAYSIKVLPNAQVRLLLVLPGAYYAADTLDVTAGAEGGILENQDLAAEFLSTVHGHVTEEDEITPIAGATVYSSTGGTAVTAEDGSFCMAAPGSTYVAVYVLGRPPVFVMTPAAATCAAGDGAEVTISVYYPKDGDRLGFVFSTLRTTDLLFGGQRKDLSSTALFYAGFKGDQFAPYDPDALLDTCRVYVDNANTNLSLAAYFGLVTQTAAFNLLYNLDFGVSETFGLDDGEVPSINKIGALDAGSPGALTNGTANIAMMRPLDYFHGFEGNGSLQDLGYALLEPWMGGFYFQEGFVSDDFNNGETLSFSWPGGLDVGPFTAQGVVPGRLSLTGPANLAAAFTQYAQTDGLTVTWDTAGQGDYVSLVFETVVIDNLFGPVHVGATVCRAADDGSYTIPASALAQMPQATAPISQQINYIIAKRHTSEKVTAPLTRDDGSGYVVLTVGTEPVMKWSIDARIDLK